MKIRILLVANVVLALTLALSPVALATTYSTIVLDGANDFAADELVGTSMHSGGGAGADLDNLYVTWDATNLYLGLDTLNADSWDVAYGFALDVDQLWNSGYSGAAAPSDAWGRLIGFSNSYLPEYEIYAWWGSTAGLGAPQLWSWSGAVWNLQYTLGASDYAWTGNFPGPGAGTGLQYLEVQVPWTAFGAAVPQRIKIYSWVAGGGGSSAVDTIPYDDNVPAGDSWVDNDILGRSWEVDVDVNPTDGIPDQPYSPNAGQQNTAVTLSSQGAFPGGGWAALPVALGLVVVLPVGIFILRRRCR